MAIVFNGITRQIEVTDSAIFELEAGKELYSAWKRWQQLSTANAGFAPAFRTFGGDPTATGQFAPKYFFLQNLWTVLINNGNVVTVALNLYSDDFVTPYIVIAGSGVSDRNSDAVSVNSAAVEFSSFQNAVAIDVDNITGKAKSGTGGAGNLVGTRATPSDNLTDTEAIAVERGLSKISVLGDLTITSVADWTRYEFTGESAIKSTITVEASANVTNCEFYECMVTGTLDGNSQIERAVISTLAFVDGFIHKCAIGSGTITLGTSTTANILACYSGIPGGTAPIIDMNSTGILLLRDYTGGVKLINYSGAAEHSIDLSAGQVILDSSTITGGTFYVRGIGKLVDENGEPIETGTWNGGVTIVNELLRADILEQTRNMEKSVFVDTGLGTNGKGTAGSPFNNIGDAIDHAEEKGIRTITIFDEITLDRNLKNFVIKGTGHPVVNCAGYDLKNTEFLHCTLRGTYVNNIVATSSVLDNGVSLNGVFERCGLNGDLTCVDASNVILVNCYSTIPGLSRPTISLNGVGTSDLSVRGLSGGLTVKDVNNALDTVTIEMSQGKVTLASSCTNGVISVRGLTQFTDDSAGSTVDTTALAENLIWDKDVSNYTVDGQAGLELQLARAQAALAAALSA